MYLPMVITALCKCLSLKKFKIREDVQIGSHYSIYSWSTIDDKKGAG